MTRLKNIRLYASLLTFKFKFNLVCLLFKTTLFKLSDCYLYSLHIWYDNHKIQNVAPDMIFAMFVKYTHGCLVDSLLPVTATITSVDRLSSNPNTATLIRLLMAMMILLLVLMRRMQLTAATVVRRHDMSATVCRRIACSLNDLRSQHKV